VLLLLLLLLLSKTTWASSLATSPPATLLILIFSFFLLVLVLVLIVVVVIVVLIAVDARVGRAEFSLKGLDGDLAPLAGICEEWYVNLGEPSVNEERKNVRKAL
jgi:hypothetical protein